MYDEQGRWVDDEPMTQADYLRLQQVNQGLAQVQSDLEEDTLDPASADAARRKLMSMRQPLLKRQKQSQEQEERDQEQQMMRRGSQLEAMAQQNAEYRAKNLSARVTPFTDPIEKRTAYLYEQSPNKWAQLDLSDKNAVQPQQQQQPAGFFPPLGGMSIGAQMPQQQAQPQQQLQENVPSGGMPMGQPTQSQQQPQQQSAMNWDQAEQIMRQHGVTGSGTTVQDPYRVPYKSPEQQQTEQKQQQYAQQYPPIGAPGGQPVQWGPPEGMQPTEHQRQLMLAAKGWREGGQQGGLNIKPDVVKMAIEDRQAQEMGHPSGAMRPLSQAEMTELWNRANSTIPQARGVSGSAFYGSEREMGRSTFGQDIARINAQVQAQRQNTVQGLFGDLVNFETRKRQATRDQEFIMHRLKQQEETRTKLQEDRQSEAGMRAEERREFASVRNQERMYGQLLKEYSDPNSPGYNDKETEADRKKKALSEVKERISLFGQEPQQQTAGSQAFLGLAAQLGLNAAGGINLGNANDQQIETLIQMARAPQQYGISQSNAIRLMDQIRAMRLAQQQKRIEEQKKKAEKEKPQSPGIGLVPGQHDFLQ